MQIDGLRSWYAFHSH